MADRPANDKTAAHRRGKKHLDHSRRRMLSSICILLGGVMNSILPTESRRPELLDVVALLIDRPDLGLSRGAIGTVVQPLDESTSLVEFSDDTGYAQAIVACPHQGLRVVSNVTD